MHLRQAVDVEDADRRAAGLDAAEVRDAVAHGATALAMDALRHEPVHVRLEVEHEVASDLVARVAEHVARRCRREEAQPRRLDRARGEDEGVGVRAAERAGAVEVFDGAHVPAVVHEARGGRVEAELTPRAPERAAQGRHGRRALGVVGAAESAAVAAVHAGGPPSVDARVDRCRVGVRLEQPTVEGRAPRAFREQQAEVHRHARRHGVGRAARRGEGVVVRPLHAVEPLRLRVAGLELRIGERPVREVGAVHVVPEAVHREAGRASDELLHRTLEVEVDGVEARGLAIGVLERAAHRPGQQIHVGMDACCCGSVAAEGARLEETLRIEVGADGVLELVVAVRGEREPRLIETREGIVPGFEDEHAETRRGEDRGRGATARSAADHADVEAMEPAVPEHVSVRPVPIVVFAFHHGTDPGSCSSRKREKSVMFACILAPSAVSGRAATLPSAASSSGFAVDMGWSGRSW